MSVTCDTVDPMSLIERTIVTLRPCTTPPSVRLVVIDENQITLFDDFLNSSSEVFVGTMMNMNGLPSLDIFFDIIINTSTPGEIGIEVCFAHAQSEVFFLEKPLHAS